MQLLRRLHPRLPAPRQGLGRRHLHRQGPGKRALRGAAEHTLLRIVTGARGRVEAIEVADAHAAAQRIATPRLVLACGAVETPRVDIVFHSATKYLAGHSDTVNGVAVTNRPAVADRLRFLQNAIGAVPGPFDCFLVLRGLRTLALRAERHAINGAAVAAFLAARDDVDWVRYPGLVSGPHAHPQAAIAARQMRNGGGMVSFVPAPRPRGDGRPARTARERAEAICAATRLFTLAESLGGVESLIEVPAVMTHASVAGSPLEVPEALVRLSCGIESSIDLIADLRHALDEA